jgi:putative peptidoglycan lipid II flippase
MTAWALRAYVLGLLSVAAVRVLVSVFYAMEQAKVPVRSAIVALFVNMLSDLALMGPTDPAAGWWGASLISHVGDIVRIADLRHAGLALGTGIAATVNASMLFLLASRRLPALTRDGLVRSFLLHASASLVMGGALWGWCALAKSVLGSHVALVDVVGGIGVSALVYLVAALAMGSNEVAGVRDLVVSRVRRSLSRS